MGLFTVTPGESMYCSTCGGLIPSGRVACATCGARVASAPAPATRSTLYPSSEFGTARAAAFATCPRCGYRGEGLGYFSRGRNLAALVLAAMFTSWAMGAGAVVYYLLRRDHRVCPRCGESWGPRGERGLVPAHATAPQATPGVAAASFAESSRAGWSIVLFLLAAILAVGAIVGGDPAPLLLAGIAAGGGLLLHRKAETEREARRAALISSLQLPVLQLASERGGRLTVTEVAAQLGWTLPRAEKVLESLEDGYRVSSDVTDEGLIVYDFRELRRSALETGTRLSSGARVTGPPPRPPIDPR